MACAQWYEKEQSWARSTVHSLSYPWTHELVALNQSVIFHLLMIQASML